MGGSEEDRAEIIKLIHASRIGMWTGDFDAWQECFVHSDYVTRWGYWSGGGIFLRKGWENIAHRAQVHMMSEIPVRRDYAYDTTVEKLTLRVDDNMAWAIFEQQYPGYDFPDHVGPGRTREVRIFERHDGRWKIAMLGFIDENAGGADDKLLHLDKAGSVVWTSPAAAAQLKVDDDVIIRNGRLRLRDRRADRKLQAALIWAAQLDADYMSRRRAVPLVLEQGEGIQSRVFWVLANNGTVVFSMGNPRLTMQRLDSACIAFGLSSTQRSVAGHVAEGLSLPQIAAEMKISANTARTHLQRIFQKTGVHNQPALVRVLLSVSSPV